ncbi:flavin monoamine oxidase family protein [Pseudomonas syringae]|uniref:flavin monoamine oxidase family protein n=1 Tax=Pseudomonas syringae TaxID=317 RepID=UPI003F75D1C3
MALTRRQALGRIAAVGGTKTVASAMAALGLGPSGDLQPQPLKLPSDLGHGSKVLVLGAGIAGLVAAFELKRAGFCVEVLEARNRVGGKNWTLRKGERVENMDGRRQSVNLSEGLYFNAGPARIPSQHRTLLNYCAELGVELEVLINSSHSALLMPDLNQSPFTVRQALNDTRGHISGLLATSIKGHALDSTLDAEERSRLLQFLRNYGDLSEALAYEGSARAGHLKVSDVPQSVLDDKSPLALEHLLHSDMWDELLLCEFPEYSPTMFQPVGGMDRIVEAFYQRLTKEVHLGAEVQKISQCTDHVNVTWRDGDAGRLQTSQAHFVISTLPFPLLANIDTDFSDAVLSVVRSARHGHATKVAWQSERFWERDDRIFGGISWLNHPARMLWYPSDRLNSPQGVLVAGYFFGKGAKAFSDTSFNEQYSVSTSAVELLHPGASQYLMNPISVSWEQQRYSEGPWLEGGTSSEKISRLFQQPLGRIYFAGDGHAQNAIGVWQESAANSARYAVSQLAERFSHFRASNPRGSDLLIG